MSSPSINETNVYMPLSKRINQDVIHDNFVPKYSALATATRTKIVLIGVWLIFLPMTFGVFSLPFYFLASNMDLVSTALCGSFTTVVGILAILILYSQTRRYLRKDGPT